MLVTALTGPGKQQDSNHVLAELVVTWQGNEINWLLELENVRI